MNFFYMFCAISLSNKENRQCVETLFAFLRLWFRAQLGKRIYFRYLALKVIYNGKIFFFSESVSL